MSATSYRWDDPYRTGARQGLTYDPSTMYGLIFKAQQGDLQAKNHLAQVGFYDQWGNDIYGGNGNGYQNAVYAWAKNRGLGGFQGPTFSWDINWQNPSSQGWSGAWDNFFNPASARVDTPNTPGANPNALPQTTPTWNPNNPGPANFQGLAAGAGQAQVQQGAPDWARYTSGNYGSTFTNIAKTFDPWGNWGQYGPALNAPKRHQRGEYMESDTDRVYRWTNDILRNMGYSGGENAPPQLRTQIFLANVERLRNEYKNNNLDWNTSAFASMERGEKALAGQAAPPPAGQNPPQTPPAAPGGVSTPAPAADPMPAIPTGYQGGNAGTSGNTTAAQRLALASDPQQAYRYMMQQLGYNPDSPGLLGNFLRKKFQPLLEARMAASGVSNDASYMDTIDQVINSFGGDLMAKGGNFFGNLANTGRQAAQQGAGFLNQLTDQDQAMQYLQQLGQLQYAGVNPLVQQAMADEMRRGMNQYEDLAFNEEMAGRNIDPFQRWLMQNPRYRSIFGY